MRLTKSSEAHLKTGTVRIVRIDSNSAGHAVVTFTRGHHGKQNYRLSFTQNEVNEMQAALDRRQAVENARRRLVHNAKERRQS